MQATITRKKLLLSGNEALAHGAFEAGLEVACAYPGTPSSEIMESLAVFPEIDAQWSVNEKVACEVALGAAIGGVRSLFACKHVGLNVAMDPLMTSSYTGTSAGFVVVVADDPGMHSSQNEQDTRWVSKYAKLPLLEPSSPAEAYEFVKEAFRISEEFDTPVLLRLTTRISHTKEGIEVGQRTVTRGAGEQGSTRDGILVPDIAKYVMIPGNAYRRHIEVEKRIEAMKAFSERTPLNRVEAGDSHRGFITSGIPYLYVKESYPDASVLKLGFSYPFCDGKIREFAATVDELYVIEELDPFLEEHLKQIGVSARVKHSSFCIGELRPESIPDIVAGKARELQRPPTRKPVLCPGCPHRLVFSALKSHKLIVTGDIGGYTLAATQPIAGLHTCICMGAGITVHEGMQRAALGRATRSLAQPARIAGVIGDSTFVHSGVTGLINAAYNGIKGLIVILDNGTTAMTGGQHHPATGKNIRGEPASQLDLEALCRACGADTVDVIDPNQYGAMNDLIGKRAGEDTLSVIIARSPCVLIDNRNRRPAPRYERDRCRACGLCLKIDCPAIKELEGGYIEIDGALCTGCDLCVEVCPFDALVSQGTVQDE